MDTLTPDLLGPESGGLPRELALRFPSPFVLTGEDALEIDSVCSLPNVTLTISGVMLSSRLQLIPFSFIHLPNSNRTIATTRTSIDSGWIMHLRVTASAGAPLVGQTFVWVRLCRGTTATALILGTICSGYVTANTDIFFPGGLQQGPLDGNGVVRSVQIANPAAGADFTITVPTGARWELVSASALFTTAAAVANRHTLLVVDDGANIVYESAQTTAQIASLAIQHSWGQAIAASTDAGGLSDVNPLPARIALVGGWRVRSSTGNIQAADQWSAIFISVREWLEGN